MARKSWSKRIVVFGILGLALFGGYILYIDNMKIAKAGAIRVGKKIVAVKKILEK